MLIATAVLLLLAGASIAYAVMGQRASTRVEGQLEHMATHDPLTGLPNRLALRSELDGVIASRRPGGRAAVLLVQLDRFAAINDTYGHDVGDQLLVAAARQVEGALVAGESIFRLAGPQFAVVAPGAAAREAAIARAHEIQQAVRVQYRITHDHLRISATVGIVLLDQRHDDRPELVLEDADAAVRHAQGLGIGTAVVFEVPMRSTVSAHDVERRLLGALERDEFVLMYLPVVSLADSTIVGVEALLRWADPERGLVAPGEFLPLLDQSDLLRPVGDWVMTEAMGDNRRWQQAHPGAGIVTTINISPAQLAEPDLIDRLGRALRDTGADPHLLCLEITEGALRTDIEVVWQVLREARELGIQLALDDFGTGYSTFDYMRKFTLDVLKIDRVFVERVTDTNEDTAIVAQLIGLAHALDLVAIAEGVDTEDQLNTLSSLGCDLAQGYYWSPPQSRDTIDQLIARRTIRSSASRARQIDWKAPPPSAAASTRRPAAGPPPG